ncbi:hypothetical protein [Magnetospirillum sulfuroxidans]|uniref:Uncharacterized protein n=1 Tax=Magnetospirillum sulfuroxidans TaxID=611300 RepID=A0ABS5IA68_9PROT|nr:hypothetical protein [Magnetospirillum sulfuroxidans]MBR9971052.1 hypothetical protein [Magnetospirillum sulfuroxidans]
MMALLPQWHPPRPSQAGECLMRPGSIKLARKLEPCDGMLARQGLKQLQPFKSDESIAPLFKIRRTMQMNGSHVFAAWILLYIQRTALLRRNEPNGLFLSSAKSPDRKVH